MHKYPNGIFKDERKAKCYCLKAVAMETTKFFVVPANFCCAEAHFILLRFTINNENVHESYHVMIGLWLLW